MKVIVVLSLVALSAAAPQYVWDLLKPALNAAEVQAILASRTEGQYPTYSEIPQTNFDCNTKKQPGFYADVDAQCQVFHRCDINGNRTSYLCVNTTVFNQITLVCDYFFNVDCSKSPSVENFANSRLYTNQPLFDTPPAEYIIPMAGGKVPGGPFVPLPSRPAPKPAKPAQKATTTTTPATVEVTAEVTMAAEETTSAAAEVSTAAAEETTSAATPAEETSAAAEATTQAAGEGAAAGGAAAAGGSEESHE
ncbi:uncharacterized protein LOC129599942 [Paramacrobiotus metropolitanus]|uniref:uncharacterized protein LOC129599942 n=1 Tax=Paramacrobiotus metropolitanus TaxID=2943436 RepID=UPI002445A029|nr:uncharacterized protein LOC129599942 [Paramacrobiotus metropolitanus]